MISARAKRIALGRSLAELGGEGKLVLTESSADFLRCLGAIVG